MGDAKRHKNEKILGYLQQISQDFNLWRQGDSNP